ncbi:MAG TPA: hypothetical protein VK528_10290 [Flavobacterium sp.]|nr:hypothetical protein [Flavobacterium sp.]
MKIKIAILAAILLVVGCAKKTNAVYYTYKTQCMSVEGDGSQTVKAWGNGMDQFDAVEQAKKNAVRDVLFTGILEGKAECNTKPLVPEVNAREKYEDYFNKFFADGGAYKNFASSKDERNDGREKKKGKQSVTYSVTVRVLRPELKQKLIADGIIK